MARVIKIAKVGKSTIVDVLGNGGSDITETYILNKSVNYKISNSVFQLESEDIRLHFLYEDLFDKLDSTDIRDYATKAATAFLFCSDN